MSIQEKESITLLPIVDTLSQKNYQSLLMALFLVLLPHFFYMPLGLSILICVVLLVWQILLLRQNSFRAAQHQLLQYGTVLLGLILIYMHYRTFLGVEAGCATLALVLLGKAFEVKRYRDAIIQLNFALFVLASVFLYGQSIVLAVAVIFGLFACLYGMYQLQSYHHAYEEVLLQNVSAKQLRQHAVKTVAKLLVVATPLMVILFLFFPRIPPLWSIPTPNQQAQTGVSDEMSPGDIAKLSQSSELAFRVVFSDMQQMPSKSALYWRAMALEDFDGVTWTRNQQAQYGVTAQDNETINIPPWYTLPKNEHTFRWVNYQMIIEPSFQKWTYALDYSVAAQPIVSRTDLSLQLPFELSQRRQFELKLLQPNPIANLELNAKAWQHNLTLPQRLNPKSQIFAAQTFERVGRDPEQYAQAILQWIRQEQFSYTLSPPLLQGERVDDFLFRTRTGFCEHYASSYVNLMRMVGIPARVVVGYQGGQAAPDGKSWEVRQLDAHAWTEVWFAGKGWQRIDPTAAIAPERIEQGMQNYSAGNQAFYAGAELAQWKAKWLTQARVWSDYVNYQWQMKVVGFDQDKQHSWLKRLSIDNLSKQLISLIVLITLCIGVVVWWLSRSQKVALSALERALSKLSYALKKNNLQRGQNEPVLTWFKRIEQNQGTSETLYQITRLYTEHMYIAPLPKEKLAQLLRLLAKYTFDTKK